MIDFQNVKSIVIPEGEVAVIARGEEILWEKSSALCTLADFTLGFVTTSGVVQQNASYPRAIVSPLISLEQGEKYVLTSDLSTTVIDQGVRIRVYAADGTYAMSVTNSNLNNQYLSISDNASTVYLATKITMEAKQDCKIRIMFIDNNYVTTATFKRGDT